MVDRAESLAPPTLRYQVVQNLAQLAQVEAALLPEGARSIVQASYSTFSAFSQGAPGNREFVFTRQALPAAMTFTYASAAGAAVNASGNALLAKGGGIWVAAPQIFRVTLNGVTPVVVAAVVNQVGSSSASAANVWSSIIRNVAGTTNGHVTVTAGTLTMNVVSDQAQDNGVVILNVNCVFGGS